jgi:V-type H+-transporting ATPase proteolipid subunit
MPPILAGILAVYGLVVAVLISGSLVEKLPLFTAFLQLGAGIAVGLSGMAAGYAALGTLLSQTGDI